MQIKSTFIESNKIKKPNYTRIHIVSKESENNLTINTAYTNGIQHIVAMYKLKKILCKKKKFENKTIYRKYN